MSTCTIDLYGQKWHVRHNPKPMQQHDWDFWHEDYDGAPDSNCGHLCGTADSLPSAVKEIEERAREYFGEG